MLLNRNDAFKEGYHNFLKSDADVALDDEHIEEAKTYIKQHLQGEIGLWTESEVKTQLLRWKVSLAPKPISATQTVTRNQQPSPIPYTEQSYPSEKVCEASSKSKMEKAVEHIKQISSLSEAQQLLEAICKLNYDNILNIILDN